MKTLAMIKMEKNFRAQEKGYPRKPYEIFTCRFLFSRIEDEVKELKKALMNSDIENAKLECADVSNLIDYLFEKLNGKQNKKGIE